MDYSSFYKPAAPADRVCMLETLSEMGPPCKKCGIPVYKPTSKEVLSQGYIECLCRSVSGFRV